MASAACPALQAVERAAQGKKRRLASVGAPEAPGLCAWGCRLDITHGWSHALCEALTTIRWVRVALVRAQLSDNWTALNDLHTECLSNSRTMVVPLTHENLEVHLVAVKDSSEALAQVSGLPCRAGRAFVTGTLRIRTHQRATKPAHWHNN